MSFAPHCGHFLLYIRILSETIGRNKKKSGDTVERKNREQERKDKWENYDSISFERKKYRKRNLY